jgi:exodeoxyribonuclease V alpha subunit
MIFTGEIGEIVYRNDENGYTVVQFETEDKYFTAVGTFPLVSVGEFLKITGEFKENRKYGEQFAVENVEYAHPDDVYGIYRYLSSGLFSGIGEKLAKEIVGFFGLKTLDILENSPQELRKVSGIGGKKLEKIIESYNRTRKMKESIVFLQKYDVTMNLALKIYQKYGDSAIDTIKANPYVIVADIDGAGFLTADRLALKLGIPRDSEFRVAAGINYTLTDVASRGGHTCLPADKLIKDSSALLELDAGRVTEIYNKMNDLHRQEADGITLVATALNYHTENSIAAQLIKLNLTVDKNDIDVGKELEIFERQTDFTLNENQKKAIKSVFDNGVSVITGGPGTGKTTIIKAIVSILKNRGKRPLLCAPTGRASKRMMQATNEEAKTIHRLIGIDATGYNSGCFGESKPLPVDVLIVDEISMADIFIFHILLKAMPLGSRLVMVGDKDQLPSVACGNILSDVIGSGIINVVYLTEVYRQAELSAIVSNAHRINKGEMPVTKDAKDFFFDTKREVSDVQNAVLSMIKTRIPKFIDVTSADIQVLAPMKKTEIGVCALNALLQKELNRNKRRMEYKNEIFIEGDKVMQTVNDYEIEWSKIYGGNGKGVFNGDIGVIDEVQKDAVYVYYDDDGKRVRYAGAALDELTLAYCISVHKSQGSEFPVVILVLGKAMPMLLTRNLVYTAITRAKKMVVIIGEENVLRYAINNTYTAKRYTLLKQLLLENRDKGNAMWGIANA